MGLSCLGRAAEEADFRTRTFIPPPTNYYSLLQLQLAYRRSASAGKVHVMMVEETVVMALSVNLGSCFLEKQDIGFECVPTLRSGFASDVGYLMSW